MATTTTLTLMSSQLNAFLVTTRGSKKSLLLEPWVILNQKKPPYKIHTTHLYTILINTGCLKVMLAYFNIHIYLF